MAIRGEGGGGGVDGFIWPTLIPITRSSSLMKVLLDNLLINHAPVYTTYAYVRTKMYTYTYI